MSKYKPLWQYIKENEPFMLTFETVEIICGFPIDHAFPDLQEGVGGVWF